MARTPLDLTFEELTEAAAAASKVAREKAEKAGVRVATLEDVGGVPRKTRSHPHVGRVPNHTR
jgi:hypothetical protein